MQKVEQNNLINLNTNIWLNIVVKKSTCYSYWSLFITVFKISTIILFLYRSCKTAVIIIYSCWEAEPTELIR